MRLAFWCVLVVLLMPCFLSLAARPQVRRADYVADPRAHSDTLDGWHRRAHLARLNAFEAVPALVAGVMVAEPAMAPRAGIDARAAAFVAFSLLHATLSIAAKPVLRSHAWRLGLICMLGLFVLAAVQGRG